jgi:hypothetical protein
VFPLIRHVRLAGWAHIVVYGIVLPLLVLRARAAVTVAAAAAAPLPDRLRHFQSTVHVPTRRRRVILHPSVKPSDDTARSCHANPNP